MSWAEHFSNKVTLLPELVPNRGVRGHDPNARAHTDNCIYRHQIRSPAGARAPAARYARHNLIERANHTCRKCRAAPGRAMKRRNDHDTSAEGQLCENRREVRSLWRLQAAGRLVLIPFASG